MIRTQISLEPEEIHWLKREAKARGTTMAGIVRDMIRSALTHETAPETKRKPLGTRTRNVQQRHPWVGICKDGPQTDASLADEHLYGENEAR
jgi:hypothetical protein